MAPRLAVIAVATGALLMGCTDPADGPGSRPGEVTVVATTTIWSDITSEIVDCAGAGGVVALMPVGADPHEYSPSSKDVVSMVSADLVVANGLGLEEGLQASIDAARADGATVLEVAPHLDPMPLGGDSAEHAEDADHDEAGHDGDDPHVWLDAQRAARAAALIGSKLTDVTGDPVYADCGHQAQAELEVLDDEVRTVLDAVPPSLRVLVTDHDALGYFAAAYGFQVAGTVVPGGSTLASPSSDELAALTDTIRATGVPAIFANTANPQALIDALAEEAGAIAVVDLYIGSLSEPGGEAGTYRELMLTDARRISDALSG